MIETSYGTLQRFRLLIKKIKLKKTQHHQLIIPIMILGNKIHIQY